MDSLRGTCIQIRLLKLIWPAVGVKLQRHVPRRANINYEVIHRWGRYLNINDPPLSVELIVGYLCYPIAFLLGVPRNGDLFKVAQLIGTKLIANEFVAYTALQTDPTYAVRCLRELVCLS